MSEKQAGPTGMDRAPSFFASLRDYREVTTWSIIPYSFASWAVMK